MFLEHANNYTFATLATT